MSRRRTVIVSAVVIVTLGVAFGLYWFQPWKLFIDRHVNEALPAVATEPISAATAAEPTKKPGTRPSPVLLARGEFITHEHSTSGTVSVVRQPDGTRVLAIADLRTSDGPVVKVWLTDQKVSKDGWHVFDDGRYVDLGGLKGNIGNQLYSIPASIFRAYGGVLSDRVGARTVMYWSLGVSAVATLFLSLPPTNTVMRGIKGDIAIHLEIGVGAFIVATFVLGFFMSLGKAAVFKHIATYYP